MKFSHKYALTIMALSMSMIIAKTGMDYHNVEVNCATEVSTENWEIKSHITTSGNVSEHTIKKVCEIIKTKVPSEAWNYLANSGGRIIVVEGDDIKDYILSHYTCKKAKEVENAIRGYCPYYKNKNGILKKVDIVIASDCLESLEHEFYHALDYSHNYSDKEEFKKLYENADGIVIFKNESARDYYMGDIEEFFAETARMFANGELTGKYPVLEEYFSNIL